MKACTKCGAEKPEDEFGKAKACKGGRRPECNACRRAYQRQWYAKNKERVRPLARERERARGAEHSRKKRARALVRKYGITFEELNAMIESKRGLCDCCGKVMDKPNVDHCHSSGKIRGVLCSGCNMGLGLMGDSIDGLKRGLEYLERHYHPPG